MLGTEWQLGATAALTVVNVLLAYAAYRVRDQGAAAGTDAAGGEDVDANVADGVVECPACGAENESGYRYCRSCVSELPVEVAYRRTTDGSFGRLPR